MQRKGVVAVIVFFNPDDEVIKNFTNTINNAKAYVEKFICVDNTAKCSANLKKYVKTNDITYINNANEGGLAKALNIGCKYAIQDGFKYCILMDQDTVFSEEYFRMLCNKRKELDDNISILCPNIKKIIRNDRNQKEITNYSDYPMEDRFVKLAITSGSMINLLDFDGLGGFDEKLFINHIDRDYSCNVIHNNKKIFRLGNVFIYQEFGNMKKNNMIRLGKKEHYAANISPMRYYYSFRNEFYLKKKWGKAYSTEMRSPLVKMIVSVILLENHKFEKLCAMYKGYYESKKMK